MYGSSVLILCAQVSKNQALALDTNLCAFDIPSFADGIVSIFYLDATLFSSCFLCNSTYLNDYVSAQSCHQP